MSESTAAPGKTKSAPPATSREFTWPRYQNERTIQRILRESHTIAVVGLSPILFAPAISLGTICSVTATSWSR